MLGGRRDDYRGELLLATRRSTRAGIIQPHDLKHQAVPMAPVRCADDGSLREVNNGAVGEAIVCTVCATRQPLWGAAMDLKDFVSQSLIQIVEGVVSASSRVAELGGAVSPEYNAKTEGALGRSRDGKSRPVQAVEFDVAVVAGSESSMEGGGGLKISVISIGAKGSGTDREQTTSRIQFVVPLQLPVDPTSAAATEANEKAVQARQDEITAQVFGQRGRQI